MAKFLQKKFVPGAIALLLVCGFFIFGTEKVSMGAGYLQGDLIINEIYSDGTGAEWVELLNTSTKDISLSGFKLSELSNPETTPVENLLLDLSGTIPAHGLVVFSVLGLNDGGDSVALYNGAIDQANLWQRVTYGTVTGYPATTGLETATTAGQSSAFANGAWLISSTPTKGWFNDAGQEGKAPLLNNLPGICSPEGACSDGIRSNIGSFEDPTNASGLYFEKEGFGKISFISALNLTDQGTVTTIQGLGQKLDSTKGHIKFSPETTSVLQDAGATLTMYGLATDGSITASDLIVKTDAGDIIPSNDPNYPVITNFVYDSNAGTVTFGASHFTQFDLPNKDNMYVATNGDDITGNGTLGTPYKTITRAVTEVNASGTVNVVAGDYIENVNLTKNLTLQGAIGTKLQGQITVSHSDVNVKDFEITNPTVGYGIVATDVSNLSITNNTIHDIGTSLASGSAQAIGIISSSADVSNITISGNTISNIGNTNMLHAGSAGSSAKGVYLGNSGGSMTISNVTISNNTMSGIYASTAAWRGGSLNYGGGAGAYGVLTNHKTTGLKINDNTISILEGLWVHAIGLEKDTPSAVLSNNTISNLVDHKTPTDAFAVYFESNPSNNTVSLNGVVLGDINTIVVDDNWIGYSNNPVVSVGDNNYIFGVNAFSTIEGAINAVLSGGTIKVAAGTYNEKNIHINKSVTLLGDPGDASAGPGLNKPVIDGSLAYGDAFLIDNGVSNVTIKGFEIKNFTSGDFDGVGNAVSAWVGSTSNITIQDNYFHDLGYNGVLVGNDKNANPSKWGDHTNWIIKGNVIENFGYIGFELTNTSNSSIENNVIHMSTPYIGAIFSSARRSENGLTIKNNQIDGSSSTSFPVIYVYAYDLDMTNPNLDSVLIDSNTITTTGTPSQIYIKNIGTGTVTGVTATHNSLSTFKNSTSVQIDATKNWWGTTDDAIIKAKTLGDVLFDPWYTSDSMTSLAQPLSATTTVSTTTTEVVVNSGDNTDSEINIPSDVTNATINVASLMVSGVTMDTVTLPAAINIKSDTSLGEVEVSMPAGMKISSDAGNDWNGVINAPQIKLNTSVTPPADSGKTANVSAVVEVGYGDTKLTFDKAVRIIISGQAGKEAGYSRSGTFTKITNVCSADTQVAGDALPAEGDCRIDVGSDLVIWTKHFTSFVSYTQANIPSGGNGGGGGSVGTVSSACFSVDYDEWQTTCVNGLQFRNIKALNPSGCAMTVAQREATQRACGVAGVKIEETKTTAETTTTDNKVTTPKVLGAKTYANGTLLKGSSAKIYLLVDGKKYHIKNLKELWIYRKNKTIKVSEEVLAQYANTTSPKVAGKKIVAVKKVATSKVK